MLNDPPSCLLSSTDCLSVLQPHRLVLGLALLLLSALTAVGNGMVLHAIRQAGTLSLVEDGRDCALIGWILILLM